MANEFPAAWFETFLSPRTAAPVDRELDFISCYLPVGEFPHLIDVPCGIGRHAGPLAELGYRVTGVDRSEWAIGVARARYPAVDFRALDMYELRTLDETFDGLLCLWQSFGYGTAEQNVGLLADMAGVLRPGGRLLMDIYNAEAAAQLPSQETTKRAGRSIRTRRTWVGSRMRVELGYSDEERGDVHEWELFNPDRFQETAESVGLTVAVSCAWFDPDIAPSSDHLRMQFLLQRPE